ncbi:ROK family protein [Beutenbergia cavernae DSM 12333]|uniref:ROK family protein n=1 Tax=Beutenbergia cavernae (strain ATCC BAA-8 / DSM 12333 / CCUG 43141 / JCM 11478 / NBRC 16432 / NCIMB 13614 / HKI 0122) TaxID=471853 RepID=C5C1E1_BEUC1|nr:ROK family protein [Beutenbergia cavernae]ACQ81551.1 ROK family protein [Beutenbergia cavernae DSM 12333]
MDEDARRLGRGRGGEPAARQASLRAHNLSLLLRHVPAGAPGISRAELANRTGLTRATVSTLVEALLAARVLAWLPFASTGSAGRPPTPVALARGTVAGLGLEVTPEHVAACAVDLAGEVLALELRPLPAGGAADVLAATAALGADVARRTSDGGARLVGTTLAVPGIVRDGVVVDAPNLGWTDVDADGALRSAPEFAPLAALPLDVGNEASLGALAQADALRSDVRTFLYVSGDVGVGGCVVLDGVALGGQHGWAGEVGHVVVDPSGPLCRCGSQGCLEQYAGAAALRRWPTSRVGSALGIALASTINVVDVSTVLLGGTLAPLVPELRPALEAELARRVLAYPWSPVAVLAAPVREHAALLGAALAQTSAVLADPSGRLLTS